jgi:hypothetical protein
MLDERGRSSIQDSITLLEGRHEVFAAFVAKEVKNGNGTGTRYGFRAWISCFCFPLSRKSDIILSEAAVLNGNADTPFGRQRAANVPSAGTAHSKKSDFLFVGVLAN